MQWFVDVPARSSSLKQGTIGLDVSQLMRCSQVTFRFNFIPVIEFSPLAYLLSCTSLFGSGLRLNRSRRSHERLSGACSEAGFVLWIPATTVSPSGPREVSRL